MRRATIVFASLLVFVACKSVRRTSVSVPHEALAEPEKTPFELRLIVDPEQPTDDRVGFEQVREIFDARCTSCHNISNALDLSRYPFNSRFKFQEELLAEIVKRLKDTTQPMPPIPSQRLKDEQIALIEKWSQGFKVEASPANQGTLFRGSSLRMRWWVDKSDNKGEWSQAWDGRVKVDGFFVKLPKDAFINIEWTVLGEDNKPVWQREFLKVDPKTHKMVFEALVKESDLRNHSLDVLMPKPGNGGVINITQTTTTSFSIDWAIAVDDKTSPDKLHYAVFMSERDNLNTRDSIMSFGIPVVNGFNIHSAKLDNLKLGATYYVNVVVSDEDNFQAIYKTRVHTTLTDDRPPIVPNKEITFESIGNTTAVMRWNGATDNSDAPQDISYVVYTSPYSNIATADMMQVNGIAASDPMKGVTKIMLKGLIPADTYYVNVAAIDRSGNRTAYITRTLVTLGGNSPDTLSSYADDCGERLGTIPSFSCFDDGQMLPITRNGVEIPANLSSSQVNQYSFGTSSGTQFTCDRPAHLPLGSYGQCIPYARIGKLVAKDAQGQPMKDVDVVFTCRRYTPRLGTLQYNGQSYDGSMYPIFEDINMIQHNRKTGETCFFQTPLSGRDGRRVPSPMEKQLPAGDLPHNMDASAYWLKPSSISNNSNMQCIRCHDNDPFIHTPYIDQAKNGNRPLVPAMDKTSDWSGKYSVIGNRGFQNWPQVYALFHDEKPLCTSCHNFADRKMLETWAENSTGRVFTKNLSDYAKQNFHLKMWMPAPQAGINSESQWNAAGYGDALDAILSCRDNPTTPPCSKKPINSRQPPFAIATP